MTNARWRTVVGLVVLVLVWLSAMYRFELVRGDQYATWRLDRWTGVVDRVTFRGLPAPWWFSQTGVILASLLLVGGAVAGAMMVVKRRRSTVSR